ncbi:acyltransferase [Undibacterium sp. CY18W]|uniref:Acyltransferase n=1 Tax=Undibacterium hunanense TaxID=2762292 RepID=A0ABR6ZWU6_9BURK|nr:acyltransferase [Undibacterium hunanense]MBC3920330.1 acyltransferase [Undibacterium hunanense]
MTLSKFADGHDNNFNLIRIIAAISVLVGHSFSLLGFEEPLTKLLGMSIGTLAVDVFFISSGFLVGKSLLTRRSAVEYLASRFLRIFPALALLTFLSTFILGPLFTTLPLTSYFTNLETYQFLLKGTTILAGISMNLPGVFEDHKFTAVNGSLWTIIYELKMYLLLLIFWAVFRRIEKLKIAPLGYVLVAVSFVSGLMLILQNFHGQNESHLSRFIFMFFTGTSFYVWKDKIQLKPLYFFVFFGLEFCAFFIGKEIYFAAYCLTIPYLLFYVAYVPAGFIRKFNLIGDYSYGVYIYAFPVQQMIISLLPGVSVTVMAAWAIVITFLFAVFSWHCVENPILNKKEHFTKKILRLRSIY